MARSGIRGCVALLYNFPFVSGPGASQRAVQCKTRMPQITRRSRQNGLRTQQGLIGRQESFVVTYSGDITLLLQSHFGLGLKRPGCQYGMTAAAGLQPRKGGLNLVDRSDHGTPEGGGSFIQPGLGKINIAAQS